MVAYDKLMQSLEIGSMRELEDFIITHCFYASIIQARLDQQKRCLMVGAPQRHPSQCHPSCRNVAAWECGIS